MLMLHRRRWATIVTVFVCSLAVAFFVLGCLTDRSLSRLEVIGVAAGIAALVAAVSWARYSEPRARDRAGVAHQPEPDSPGTGPQRVGVTDVRIDGIGRQEFATPASAKASAHRLRWCGKDEVLTAKAFLLREPLVYYSVSAPADDEPSCIDLSLDARSAGRSGETSPSVYPNYSGLSPAERAAYLDWLSEDRTTSSRTSALRSCSFVASNDVFCLSAALNEIVKEIVRLRVVYASSRVLELHLNRFLSFAVARFDFGNFDSELLLTAFEKPPPNCKEGDLAVALAWFLERDLPLPASWATAIVRQDPRVAGRDAFAAQNDQLTSLFELRYRKQFGTGLRLRASGVHREIQYRPVNASLEYRDDSQFPLKWSVRIIDVLSDEPQIAPLAELLKHAIRDLPPLSNALEQVFNLRCAAARHRNPRPIG